MANSSGTPGDTWWQWLVAVAADHDVVVTYIMMCIFHYDIYVIKDIYVFVFMKIKIKYYNYETIFFKLPIAIQVLMVLAYS